MSDRPSFQFYPADWKANANLRRCSPAARGVWMDCLCLFHDSAEYGLVHWPLKEIARTLGASMSHLKELIDKCVLKGSDTELNEPFVYTPRSGRRDGAPVTLIPVQRGPVWFSSRMVKDEYVRKVRGSQTRFGDTDEDQARASNHAPNTSPKPPKSDGSSSTSSSASSGSPLPSPPSPENKNLKNGSRHVENGLGNGASSFTIEDPNDRMARFQAKIATHLGPDGWTIVYAATQSSSPEHKRSLAVCQQAARALGKGWPKAWPIT